MVHTVDPSLGKKIYDPGCATGGFLAVAYAAGPERGQHAITLRRVFRQLDGLPVQGH